MTSTSPARSAAATLEKADVAAAKTLAQGRRTPPVQAAAKLSEVGDQLPLFGLSCAVLGFGALAGNRRASEAGARMLAALLVASAVKAAIKRSVARTRPHVVLDTGHYEVKPFGPDEGPWHSFPSGHTAGSVAVARAAARVYPEARVAAYTAAAAIALAQLPRGAHYPVDVAAGLAIGVAAETLSAAAFSRWLQPRVFPDGRWAEELAEFGEAPEA